MAEFQPPLEINPIFNVKNFEQSVTQELSKYLNKMSYSLNNVNGKIALNGGAQLISGSGQDKILTSDGAGNFSWQYPSTLAETIYVNGAYVVETPTKKNSIYSAVQQCILNGEDPSVMYHIVVAPGVYIEYQSITITNINIHISTLTPSTNNNKPFIFLVGDVNGVGTSWITANSTFFSNLVINDLMLIRCDGFNGSDFGLPIFGNLPGAVLPAFTDVLDVQQTHIIVSMNCLYFGPSLKFRQIGWLYSDTDQIFSTSSLAGLFPYPFDVSCVIPPTGAINTQGDGLGSQYEWNEIICYNISNGQLIAGVTLEQMVLFDCKYTRLTIQQGILDQAKSGDTLIKMDNTLASISLTEFRPQDPTAQIMKISNNTRLLVNGSDFATLSKIIKVMDTSSTFILIGGLASRNLLDLTSGDQQKISVQSYEPDRSNFAAIYSYGDLAVGDSSFPSSTYLGQGKSNRLGLIIYKYQAPTYTDVSSQLYVNNTTPVTLFSNIATKCFIGMPQVFSTLSVQVSAAYSGTLVFEYWNGASFITFNVMNTQANSPFTSYADTCFNQIEQQEIRFDTSILSLWTQSTINSQTKYWLCIRSTSFTTSGSVLYIYPTADSSKFNNNGIRLLYGRSRLYKSIPFSMNLTFPTSDASTKPATQDLYYGTNNWQGRNYNSLTGNGRRFGFSFYLPIDMDTSSPLRIIISYISSSSSAALPTYTCNLTTCTIAPGKLIYLTSGATVTEGTNFQSIPTSFQPNQTNGNNMAQITQFAYFAKSLKGGLISLQLNRTDAFANSLVIVEIALQYLSFIDGAI